MSARTNKVWILVVVICITLLAACDRASEVELVTTMADSLPVPTEPTGTNQVAADAAVASPTSTISSTPSPPPTATATATSPPT